MLTNRKDNRNLKIGKKITNLTSKLLQKLEIVRMQNFQYTFETRKQSFISAFSICMTAPLRRAKFDGRFGMKKKGDILNICQERNRENLKNDTTQTSNKKSK